MDNAGEGGLLEWTRVSLAEYQLKLSALNVDRSSGHPKPHKVCLLFAVMDLIEQGKITENKIVLNQELKEAFSRHFEKLKKGNDDNKINNPFMHLLGEGFWRFKYQAEGEANLQTIKDKKQTPGEKAITDNIEYAYLDTELYEYFTSNHTRQIVKEALLENLEDLSEQFLRWMLSTGRAEKTAQNYLQAIRGSMSTWASEEGITQKNLIAYTGYSTFQSVAEKIAQYDAFKGFNKRGNGMYQAALNAYRDFLMDTGQVQVSEDIAEIIANPNIPETQKAMLVNTRIGQGKFREKLINYWQGCAVTGYQSARFLVASHIKPWRASNNEERLDTYNGLLLLPNLDKAFDLGYISFEESGKVKISEALEEHQKLGIMKGMKINLVKEHQDYLAYHREIEFKR